MTTTTVVPPQTKHKLRVLGTFWVASFLMMAVSAGLQFVPGVAVGIGGLVATEFVANIVLPLQETLRVRVIASLVAIAFGVVAIVLRKFVDAEWTNGSAFAGACLILLGLGQLVTAWRGTKGGAPYRGWALVGLAAALCVGGLAGLSTGMSPWWLGMLAAGVFLLAPVGLNVLTEDVLTSLPSPANRRPQVLLMVAGVGCAAGGVAILAGMFGLGFPYVAAAGIVVVLLIGAIAVNVPADVIVVVGVAALLWSAAPRGIELDPETVPAENSHVIVAMGDSFMSGEGAPRFYEGTNTKDWNECRRAPSAYVPVAVSRNNPAIPDRLLFVACSAARAVNIYAKAQEPGDPLKGPRGGLNQLDHVTHLRGKDALDVDLVVVSIGGNDASFGEIGMTCVAPGDCSEYGARWLRKLDQVTPAVYRAYQEIRKRFGATVPVVVVPYPVPLSGSKCDWSLLTPNEHRFLHGYTEALNGVLRRAASDAGFYYLGEMEGALARAHLRICDGNPDQVGVNFLAVNSVSGLIEQGVNPQNWFHNSLHPKENGHRAMADVLETWLNNHPDLTTEPTDDQGPPRTATIEEIMGDPSFHHCDSPGPQPDRCAGTVGDWTRSQLVNLAWRAALPLGVLVLGGWLLWVGLIWWRRKTPATG